MPITSIEKDLDELTMTVVADFGATVQRLWDAYADPRQIERFWGPPQWPATFTRHDMVPGGRSAYVMTGPDGERAGGYWEFLAVDAPRSFEVRDGFADADGTPRAGDPTVHMRYSFEETPNGSRLTTVTTFDSLEDLEQLLAMGMEEGLAGAMGQIDDVLADLAAFAAGSGTELQLLDDVRIRVSRIIRGTPAQVFGAHHDPELLRRWLLGPEGWTMPVCEAATDVGQQYRYEWENASDGTRFGFTGELLEVEPPTRSVTTERMIGTDGPSTLNELTLTPVHAGTLLVTVITYPDSDLRDTILATGMVDGMETSYARLEAEVLTDG